MTAPTPDLDLLDVLAAMPSPTEPASIRPVPDPTPWRHTSGTRVADPFDPDGPQGGFTYDPRPGYSDYPDRYISTRHKETR